MRIKCKSDSTTLPPHEYCICFPLTVSHFSRHLCFDAILNLGSYPIHVYFSVLKYSVALLSEWFKHIPAAQTQESLLGWSRVKAIVPRRGL